MLEINFHPFPVIKTDRLILRQVTAADAADILILRSDEQAMKYIARPRMSAIEDAQKFIGMLNDNVRTTQAIDWAITLSGDDRLIGTICLWNIQKEDYRAEIGYMLLPAYWRKGLLSEAAKAVIGYGFNTMRLHSIEAHVWPENIASSGLLEKHGFVKEAYFKENFFFNGAFEDTVVYSLLNH